LETEFVSGNYDTEVLRQLSMKCDINKNISVCSDVYNKIIAEKEKFQPEYVFKAELYFSDKKLSVDIILPTFEIIEKYQDYEFVKDAYMMMIQYYKENSELEEESKLFKELSDRYPNNPSILNSYAWRMSELKLNLNDAIQKADKAIALSADDLSLKSYIIDTKAELLWIQGDINGAIETIQEAIYIDSKSDYFNGQLDKFKESQKEN